MKRRKILPFFFLIAVAFALSETPNLAQFFERVAKQELIVREQKRLADYLAKVEKRIDDLEWVNSVRPIELRIKEAEETLIGFAKLPVLVSQLEARLEAVNQLNIQNILPLEERLNAAHNKLRMCPNIEVAIRKLKGCSSKTKLNEIQNDVMSLRQKDESLEKLIQNEIAALKQTDQNVKKQLQSINEQLKLHQTQISSTANKAIQVEDIVSRHDSLINSSVTVQNENIADRLTQLDLDAVAGKIERDFLFDNMKQVKEQLRKNEAETKSQNTQLSSLNAEYSNLSIVLNDLRAQRKTFRADFSHDVIVEPSTKRTALHVAVVNGKLEEVRELLKNGSNIEAEDSKKLRPLHLATRQDEIGVIRELLDNGAEVNAIDVYGDTPLHWAVQESRVNYVDLLLKKGAHIEARDSGGETPLYKACCLIRKIEMIELLLRMGANTNTPRIERVTPFHAVVESGQLDLVKLLVENGADVHAKTFDGRTAIHIAEVSRYRDVVNYLKLHM